MSKIIGEAGSKITVYADGACKGNPGPGGWGAYFIVPGKGDSPEETYDLFGGCPKTTNNRMEISALINTLASAHDKAHLLVYTDSKLVVQGVNEWLRNWKRNGWKTSSREPVKNLDLWQSLDRMLEDRQAAGSKVQVCWVKGHNGHPGNEKADQLANQGVASIPH